ncbi:hypothetical protein ACFX13_030942 [Malus domestica]
MLTIHIKRAFHRLFMTFVYEDKDAEISMVILVHQRLKNPNHEIKTVTVPRKEVYSANQRRPERRFPVRICGGQGELCYLRFGDGLGYLVITACRRVGKGKGENREAARTEEYGTKRG